MSDTDPWDKLCDFIDKHRDELKKHDLFMHERGKGILIGFEMISIAMSHIVRDEWPGDLQRLFNEVMK